VSCALHATLAMLVVPLERSRAVDAASLVGAGASPAVTQPVEMVVVATEVARRPEVGPTAMAAAAIATRAPASAPLAEAAARPGGRAARPRYGPASPSPSSPPVARVDTSFDESADSAGDTHLEVVSDPASSQPIAAVTAGAAVDPAPTAAAPAVDPAAGPSGEGDGDHDEEGQGAGSGAGRGDGAGDVATDAWGKELHARVLGDVRVDLKPREGRRVISHEQATALRVRDVFPRMPEALWPGWRPYLVTLEVCVDEEGGVSDVDLLSRAAPRLDRMVVAAARTWRYRPLLLAGAAVPFCHAVVIKYEPW